MFTKHRGEFLLFMGALFFSANGITATVVLSYMSAFRLAQIRIISGFLILFIFALLFKRSILSFKRSELPTLISYGVVGFALVNFGYFLGIERGVPLGLVLILEFTAPIWIALWIKFVRKGFVARDMWIGIALALLGLVLVSKIWDGFAFDLIGVLGSLGSAFALAFYFLIGKKLSADRTPIASLIFGFGFASAFWLVVLPPWNFPFSVLTETMQLQGTLSSLSAPGWVLIAYVVIFGTIVPYLFVIAGLRLLTASKASVLGMLEPVIAGIFAWIILSQSWDWIQLIGAAIVLVAIYIADRSKSVE